MELPLVSSLQCVDALWRLGFEIEDANDVRVRLVRADGRRVAVSRHKTIEPLELRVILHTAGVDETVFLEVFHERTGSFDVIEPEPASTGVRARHRTTERAPKMGTKGRAG